MAADPTRLTVEISSELLEEADIAVRAGHARTRDELVVVALRHELETLAGRRRARRATIDAEFDRMAGDSESQAEAMRLDREFAVTSWEAFQVGEES
jgi:hypothetical protein